MIAVDYYLIQYLVNNEIDKILVHERERIDFYLESEGTLPPSNYMLKVSPVEADNTNVAVFKDTLIYEAYSNNSIPYRTYTFRSYIDSRPVSITLKHVLLEINELIWILFFATSLILFFLVTGIFFINRKIYKWAWDPFFVNLSKLKKYDVTQKESIHLKKSNIREFEELNKVNTALINRVQKDFQNLKEFNENISHEIQTPLAVIRNKVVLLLESKNLDERELRRVEAIYQETNKLSKIGKSLTLISRIENQEFKRLDKVDVLTLIENILSNMEEIISFKELRIDAELNPMVIECDHILADILFTNLIKNAVQHNTQGGLIRMRLDEEKFVIGNSGEDSDVEIERLFERFKKGNPTKDSLGLGLSISRKICEIYGFRLEYEKHEETHVFSLTFKSNSD
jgi:signal transduction histidine kinase